MVFGVEFLFAKKGKEVDLRFLPLVKGYVHLPMLYEGNLVDDMHWIVLVLLQITISLTFSYPPLSHK